MMRAKCSVFIATSLDGFISRNDGSIDWLIKANSLVPPGEDGGYSAFISTIDGLIMGRHSFEKVLSFDPWPYGELPVVVLSSQPIRIPNHLKSVSHSAETPNDLLKRLSREGFRHLYIDGGITIQRFLADNLIDELTITVIPILLGSGRRLFGPLNQDIELTLKGTRTLDCGFVQLVYEVLKEENAHPTQSLFKVF